MNLVADSIKNKIRVFENKKILITGASGLIGFNLLITLKNYSSLLKNISVVTTSLNPLPNYLLKELENFTFEHYTFEDFKNEYADKQSCFNFIFHCAGYGQPKKFIDSPYETIDVNTNQIIFISNLLDKNGKMFYLSSSEIYSNSKTLKPNELDIGCVDPTHERAIYIESKKLGESICNSLVKKGKNIIVLRVSLVYGPGAKIQDERVLNEFIIRGIIDRKITLLDEGKAIRTYLSMRQFIYWLISLSEKNNYNIYNVSGNQKVTIKELADIVGQILDVQIEIGNKQGLKSAPKSVEIDNSRIMLEYPIDYQFDFKSSIKEVVDWYRKII